MPKRMRKDQVVPALAKPGDPLVAENGQIIKPAQKRVDVEKDQPKITAKNFKPSKKRTLKELPATPRVINGCAIVFVYSLLGLSDREIAQAAKIKPEEVAIVKQHPAYAECFEAVAQEFISANSALLAARIGAYAHGAVTKIADISQNGKHENNALRASIDIADRATGNKSSVYGGGQQSGGSVNELRIIIVDGDREPVDIPVDRSQFETNGASHGD